MKIIYKIKTPGKKESLIKQNELEIEVYNEIITLEELLKAITKKQVEIYNQKLKDKQKNEDFFENPDFFVFDNGKFSFGNLYNLTEIDLNKALERTILGFKDGLFSVFYDEEEIQNLTSKINLSDKKVFTFIKLAFLLGSIF